MYIRGLIPGNFEKLAEAVLIGHNLVSVASEQMKIPEKVELQEYVVCIVLGLHCVSRVRYVTPFQMNFQYIG